MTVVDLCRVASLHHALLRLVIGSSEGEDSHSQEGIARPAKYSCSLVFVFVLFGNCYIVAICSANLVSFGSAYPHFHVLKHLVRRSGNTIMT